MSKTPITQKFIDEWREAYRRSAKMEDTITERIDYILRTIFETFGAKLDYWYFDGAAEGEVGDLARWMDDDEISGIYTEAIKEIKSPMVIIDKFGDEWEYQGEIPTRWLFDAEFAIELHNGKLQHELKEKERKEKQKERSAAKKKRDELLVEEAKKKLSKEELAAIRRSV